MTLTKKARNTHAHLPALARRGAEEEYADCLENIATLKRLFPGIKPANRLVARLKVKLEKGLESSPKKRNLSAAARKAISDAQKKRWSQWRRNKKN